eukprot:7622896-Pyramimonas_sp.AAC.1
MHRFVTDHGLRTYQIPILLKEADDIRPRTHWVDAIPPHEMFAALWRAGPDQDCVLIFLKTLRGGRWEWRRRRRRSRWKEG